MSDILKLERSNVCVFKNHSNYKNKDANGDFCFILAFCDDVTEGLRLFSHGLSGNADLACCVKKLVSEYNKKPYINRIKSIGDKLGLDIVSERSIEEEAASMITG